jgi:hypothetical protein
VTADRAVADGPNINPVSRRDAVAMSIFRLLWKISLPQGAAQCGQGIEGSADLIGIACENHEFRSPLTLLAMLALY